MPTMLEAAAQIKPAFDAVVTVENGFSSDVITVEFAIPHVYAWHEVSYLSKTKFAYIDSGSEPNTKLILCIRTGWPTNEIAERVIAQGLEDGFDLKVKRVLGVKKVETFL